VAVVARELGIDADAERLAGMLTPDMPFGLGAFLVTNLWLGSALKAAEGADRPELLNTDGDPLEFTTLHFPLLPGVAAPTLCAALAANSPARAECGRAMLDPVLNRATEYRDDAFLPVRLPGVRRRRRHG